MGAHRSSGMRQGPIAFAISAAFAAGLATPSLAQDLGQPNYGSPTGVEVDFLHAQRPADHGVFRPERTSGTGATLPVTSCADDGSAGTLRQVVAGAASGDIIDLTQLTCSAITLQSGQIVVHADDLTLNGPGAGVLAVDANHASSAHRASSYVLDGRAFYHDGAGTLTINGLAVINGLVYYYNAFGGCIYSKNGGVTLNDALVSGCTASALGEVRGGGIDAFTHIDLNRTTITGNVAITYGHYAHFSSGGGIFTSGGDVTVHDSSITNNRSEASYQTNIDHTQASGGGISAYVGDVIISGTLIADNFVGCDTTSRHCRQGVGGGIRTGSNLTLTDSVVSTNVVQGEGSSGLVGGGIEAEGGALTVVDSAITGNRIEGALYPAVPIGGGVVAGVGLVSISGSTISGNTSSYFAGGMWLFGTTSTVVNSTISSNVAEGGPYGNGYVGGIWVKSGGPLLLDNCTVTLNESDGLPGGGGIVDQHSRDPSDFESSIVAGNINTSASAQFDADLSVQLGMITGANNLIVAANGVTLPPDTINADPMLGPLQDNGGSTLTHAPLPGSPAIDTGNNAANLNWDQRGDGYPRVVGLSADIGAVEYSATDDQPPVAANDTYTTAQDTTLTVNAPGVLANDSDPEGDSLTAVLVSNPSNGTLTLNPDGSFVYVPAAGFSGTDSFTYEANDGQLHSNIVMVTIKVGHVDQSPIAANDSYTTAENATLKVSVPGVLGNDSDPDGDPLTAILVSNPSNGTLTLNPDGSFVYVPAPSFSGTDSFTYEANDGQLNSNIATVTIKISHVDQPPVAANDSYTTAANTTLAISAPGVLGNDSDPDGDTLTALLISNPSNGTLTLNPDGSFVYVPAEDFFGTDAFTYEANDGQLNSNVATVTITVTQGVLDTIFANGFDGP